MESAHLTKGIADLYLDRILECEPDLTLDEGYDRARGYREPVDVTFGSSGYTVSLANVLAGESRSIFVNGYCGLLAHQVAAAVGVDRFLLVTTKESHPFHSSSGWSGHVLAESTRDGLWIDFDGEHTESAVGERYTADSYTSRVVGREEFMETVIGESHRDDPMGFLDPLEQAFTRMVVDAVLERVERPYR